MACTFSSARTALWGFTIRISMSLFDSFDCYLKGEGLLHFLAVFLAGFSFLICLSFAPLSYWWLHLHQTGPWTAVAILLLHSKTWFMRLKVFREYQYSGWWYWLAHTVAQWAESRIRSFYRQCSPTSPDLWQAYSHRTGSKLIYTQSNPIY